MITRESDQIDWGEAGVILLPTLVVLLYSLLSLRLQTPTAGGLSFLAAALIAFFFFPRKRVRAVRLVGAVLLAAVVGVLLANLG
jgi:L-lactate permease